jgi:hypothetical protein
MTDQPPSEREIPDEDEVPAEPPAEFPERESTDYPAPGQDQPPIHEA